MTEDEKKTRVAAMLSQAAFASRSCDPLLKSLAADVQELAANLANAESTIRDFAWRADCWSEQDIVAHVADYFGVTVAEIEKQMQEARNGS